MRVGGEKGEKNKKKKNLLRLVAGGEEGKKKGKGAMSLFWPPAIGERGGEKKKRSNLNVGLPW